MKVLIINTSERNGGAAVAANRLMHAHLANGMDVKMLVRDKQTEDINVLVLKKSIIHFLQFVWERICIFLKNSLNREKLFEVSLANTGSDISRLPEFQEADIIHLHWINQGMISLKNLRRIKESGKPVVWTLHDMWPLTGICHYAHTCDGFKKECGFCPFLNSTCKKDVSNQTFKKKQSIYENWSLEIVTVSNWLSKQVKMSTLLKNKSVTVIPNTLSMDIFHPSDKQKSRLELNLPAEKKILVFGAAKIDNPIKGFQYLNQALHLLSLKTNLINVHLVLFGQIKSGPDFLGDLPVSYTWMGHVTDTVLSKIYSASDVLIAPSLYETFGQTLIEAQACGCIPVCFNNSGQTDIISHRETGYLADYLSVESLRDGIYWAIEEVNPTDFAKKSKENIFKNYTEKVVSDQYLKVYERALNSKAILDQ